MNWDEYVSNQLEKDDCLSGLRISLNNNPAIKVPPIVRISSDILNRYLYKGNKRLVFVFPENNLTRLMFALSKTMGDIDSGRIGNCYDPYTFKKGQKLKYKNCIVEFNRIDEFDGRTLLFVKTADNCISGTPIEFSPLFQLVETNRRLSKDQDFSIAKREMSEAFGEMGTRAGVLTRLANRRTHIEKSVLCVGATSRTEQLLENISINRTPCKNIMLFGHSDYEGNIKMMGAGQYTGVPAIVFTPDLYAASSIIQKGNPVQVFYWDVAHGNALTDQLDALDAILETDLPIVCTTSVENSFGLSSLEARNFEIWRWDENCITEEMWRNSDDAISSSVKICVKQKTQYVDCGNNIISQAVEIMQRNRRAIIEATGNVSTIFDKLYYLALFLMRNVVKLSVSQVAVLNETLETVIDLFNTERPFISSELVNDFNRIIDIDLEVLVDDYPFLKVKEIEKILEKFESASICIIVSDRDNTDRVQCYWESFCNSNNLDHSIETVGYSEYVNKKDVSYSVVIITSWFGEKWMRRILHSYKSLECFVLLYECEKCWKNSHVRKWSAAMHNDNVAISEKAHNSIIYPSAPKETPPIVVDKVEDIEDFDEFKKIMKENKYRRYSLGDVSQQNRMIPVIPASFIGGCMIFYRTTHKIVSCSMIVLGNGKEVQTLFPTDLKIGDFVVVREANKDIIKDLANDILKKSGEYNKVKIAAKWKEALEMESVFSSEETIYKRLKNAGCTVAFETFRNWMRNESMISPQRKEDMQFIAEVTEDQVLLERIDEVFEAGRVVHNAHRNAGRILSKLLIKQIKDKLQELGDIDPFNIWDPISFFLEGIGKVKIFKITDVGDEISVDISNTNRIIDER